MLAGEDGLFAGVTFKALGNPPYLEVDGGEDLLIRTQATSEPEQGANAPAISLSAGDVVIAFAIGDLANLDLLVCVDNRAGGSCAL